LKSKSGDSRSTDFVKQFTNNSFKANRGDNKSNTDLQEAKATVTKDEDDI
jgi:hypothetical protein